LFAGADPGVFAEDKPAGELWQQTVSMEMSGMNMPPRTLQVCVPQGKANETLSKPQGPGMGENCAMQDAKHEGNRFTARMICTGKQPMEGTIESVFDKDHAKTTMTLSMSGRQMTMKTDSQKLGTPCTPRTLPGAK
jgi:hypothetical protein